MEQAPWQHSLRLRIDTEWRRVADAIFGELILSRGMRAVRSDRWNVAPGPLETLPGSTLFHHAHSFGTDDWLLDFPPYAFALIEHQGETLRVRVAADMRAWDRSPGAH
jgi:hypothetical protein